jgi:hypothetical protein
VIALAYAAAVVVMLAGFNPADLARKAGVGRIEETARASVQVAGNSLADRLGAIEENALRTLARWRGHVTGYGRAAISTAIALVMRSEPQRPPNRPRSGEDKGVFQKNERNAVSARKSRLLRGVKNMDPNTPATRCPAATARASRSCRSRRSPVTPVTWYS